MKEMQESDKIANLFEFVGHYWQIGIPLVVGASISFNYGYLQDVVADPLFLFPIQDLFLTTFYFLVLAFMAGAMLVIWRLTGFGSYIEKLNFWKVRPNSSFLVEAAVFLALFVLTPKIHEWTSGGREVRLAIDANVQQSRLIILVVALIWNIFQLVEFPDKGVVFVRSVVVFLLVYLTSYLYGSVNFSKDIFNASAIEMKLDGEPSFETILISSRTSYYLIFDKDSCRFQFVSRDKVERIAINYSDPSLRSGAPIRICMDKQFERFQGL